MKKAVQYYIEALGHNLYEARLIVIEGSIADKTVAGALQFSLVVPHGTVIKLVSADQPRKAQDRRCRAKWHFPRNRVNAPSVTPDLDYISAVFDLSPTNVYPEIETWKGATFFRFYSSSTEIRMFRNNDEDVPGGCPADASGQYDPYSKDLNGGDFNNSFTVGNTAECYNGNYEL